MARERWVHGRQVEPDAAARDGATGGDPRAAPGALTDNPESPDAATLDDPEGLPLRVRLLDLPQPRRIMHGGAESEDPPALLTTYGATRLGTDWRVRAGEVPSGASTVRSNQREAWVQYWAETAPHLRVADAGWVIWRDFAVISGRSCVPHVLVECPAVDEAGARWRVRVYVRPSVFALSTESVVAAVESELWGMYAVGTLAERYAVTDHGEYRTRRQAAQRRAGIVM